ncbi:MAG TPA: hypothetical protein VII72_06175 [Myxococcota bacterium]|jgi:hypothetical protein
MSRAHTPASLLALCLVLLIVACTPQTGHLRLARPHVYDSKTTRDQLAESGKTVSDKIRADADLSKRQEAFSAAETTALAARVAGQGAAPGAVPGTPGVPTPGTAGEMAKPPPVVSAEIAKDFGRTVEEQVSDLLHKEGQAVEVQLLYSGKGDPDLGPKARVYLVRFDIGILPTRQKRFSYPWWVLQSGFGSTYRFTEGWFARVSMQIQSPLCSAGGPVYVYEIDPRQGVLTALDAVTNVNQLQLAAAYMQPGAAGQLDYLNRLEEQFAQQRRYPLQLGFIDGPCRFSWIFGPRRIVQKRGWVRFIPFVSDYEVQSRLEPGTRTGHVILVAPNVETLKTAAPVVACPTGSKRELDGTCVEGPKKGQESAPEYKISGNLIAQVEPERSRACGSNEKPEDYARLCLNATAAYLELDRPNTYVPISISSPDGAGAGRVVPLALDLPLSMPAEEQPVAATFTIVSQLVAENAFEATLTIPGKPPCNPCFTVTPAPDISIVDTNRKQPLEILDIVSVTPTEVKVKVLAPREPTKPAAKVELSAAIESDGHRWKATGTTPYSGPPWRPDDVVLECPSKSGASGSLIGLQLTGFKADAIEYIQFGNFALKPGAEAAGWAVADQGRTVRFTIPRQLKKNAEIEPPPEGAVVDVSVHLKDKTARHARGGFTYKNGARCLS